MRVVVAPEEFVPDRDRGTVSVFLAGGITNCPDWQHELIDKLSNTDLLLFNPRREKFDINDPNAARQQIEWEFKYLMSSWVFSMWFCASEKSDLPICFYELGRYLALSHANGYLHSVAIGVDPNFKRINDVLIQTELVSKDLAKRITFSLDDHAKAIIAAAEQCR